MVPDGAQMVPICSETDPKSDPKLAQVFPVGGLPLRYITLGFPPYMKKKVLGEHLGHLRGPSGAPLGGLAKKVPKKNKKTLPMSQNHTTNCLQF